MFGRKKEEKPKEQSRREQLLEIIASEVEQLTPGQSLVYKLPQAYWEGWAAFLIAEPNPTYPQKGKRFCTYTDKIKDGKPAGKRADMGQVGEAKEIADWIADRDGRFGSIERYQ